MNKLQAAVFPGLLIVALTSLPAAAAPASEASAECQQPRITSLQQRVVAKSEQGVEALRQFVFNTRVIYQLDMVEVADWATARRAAVRQCMEAAAATEAARQSGG